MQDAHSIRDDSALLLRWVRDGSDEAFAELVHGYERLVVGAALRRTGDAELARDVAQQVFATLAAKAHGLTARKNLAGWLYCAASHIAARTAHREARRRREHQALTDSPKTSSATHWPLVEEALAKLGAKERESLILHYFEELSYAQIAATLGIEEAAARKRVSRALQRLEARMRPRAVPGSIGGILAVAAAQQSSVAAQPGLAAAALAASGVGNSTSFALIMTTFLSSPPLKIAAAASILLLTPLIWQNHANAKLRVELADLRRARPVGTNVAALQQQHASRETALAAKRRERIAAENRAANLATLGQKLADEVVISFGTLDNMARKLARVLSAMEQLDPGNHAGTKTQTSIEREKLARELSETIPEMMSIVREIPHLEREPSKAARFYATLLSELLQGGEKMREAIEPDLKQWVENLQNDGLALVQRPRGKAPDWDARRNSATLEVFTTIAAKVSSDKNGPERINGILRTGLNAEFYEFVAGAPGR